MELVDGKVRLLIVFFPFFARSNFSLYTKRKATRSQLALIILKCTQVSKDEMLSAPSSFRRFMEATKRAKEQQQRRERQYRISQGLEVSDDEETPFSQKQKFAATGGSKGDTGEKPAVARDKASTEGDGLEDDDDGPRSTWLRPDTGDRANDREDEDARDDTRATKGKKGAKSGGKQGDDEDENNGKRKYTSLRERKREARKMAKTAKEEGDVFMHGRSSGKQEKSRGGDPSFGEVTDAPPTITLKRKSGGKGAKPVPVAESGHKIAGGKGAGNRQAQIFKDLMQNAQGKGSSKSSAEKNAAAAAGVGLRRVAEMKALREQVIVEYRQMRGRPMNNGRSASLAVDPSRLFSATVGAATIRRDAGK